MTGMTTDNTDTKPAPFAPIVRELNEAEGALFACLKVELATLETPTPLVRCSDELRAFRVVQSQYIANLSAAIASLRMARFASEK